MSNSLLQIFAFMFGTFALGLLLGWVLWRLGGASQKAIASLSTEIDFWRSNLDECRIKLSNEQTKVSALHEEKANLKKRLASLTS